MIDLKPLVFGWPMRIFMTLLWVSVSWGPINADYNETHLFNPDWPPHARLHMMTVFTSAVALTLFNLFLIWGRTNDRPERLRLSAVVGALYVFGLLVATMTMPVYGGSLHWEDVEPRAASFSDGNLIIFLVTEAVFLALLILLYAVREPARPQ